METYLKTRLNTACYQERSIGTNYKHILIAEQHEFFASIQVSWTYLLE